MKFNFIYKNKKVDIDVEKCDNVFSQARGLMFKKNSKPLLFIFKDKKIRGIHSFFCMPFIAIWFDEEKIIDIKKINSKKILIKPLHKFDKLLEIPSNAPIFDKFLDEEKI
jgi:uncharacterized membrane protein (UPF0127 family)